MLLVFSGIIVASFVISDPMLIIRRIAAFSAIVFGIFGFIVIYLDLKLPKYARGNRLWLMIMGIGSVISIYVALLLESAFLTYGVPLIERMLVVAFVLYIFSKTELFKKLLTGRAGLLDKFWTVILFGAISVYGTFRGIPVEGVIINFRDVGPMIAGLIGGPFVGAAAGVIGGVHRYLEGGATALPCFAATILAGIVAGLLIRHWRGRLSMFRAAVLAIGVECLHLLFVLPVLTIPFGTVTPAGVLGIITITILPMCMVNIAGLLIFAYIVRKYDAFSSGLSPQLFSLRKLREDLRTLMHPPDEEESDTIQEDKNVR